MFLNVLKNIITNKRRILLTQELFVEAPFFSDCHTLVFTYTRWVATVSANHFTKNLEGKRVKRGSGIRHAMTW